MGQQGHQFDHPPRGLYISPQDRTVPSSCSKDMVQEESDGYQGRRRGKRAGEVDMKVDKKAGMNETWTR